MSANENPFKRELENLVTRIRPEGGNYKPQPGRGGKGSKFLGDRTAHATKLNREYEAVWATSEEEDTQREGAYATFTVHPDRLKTLESLNNRSGRQTVELRSAKTVFEGNDERLEANVFIPSSRKSWFEKKLNNYSVSDGEKEAALVESVEQIRPSNVNELWTDKPDFFPQLEEELFWWEVWLSRDPNSEEDPFGRLRQTAESRNIEVSLDAITLNDRTVALVLCNQKQMEGLLRTNSSIAELRSAAELAVFLTDEPALDQAEWAEDAISRVVPADGKAPAVCVLDQGIYWKHSLLDGSISSTDCHAAKNVHDFKFGHDPVSGGHGTEMAGLALFYDLNQHVGGTAQKQLLHRLESVKIMPNENENAPQLYGAITAMAVSRPEVSSPDRPRVFMLAVTAVHRTATSISDTAGLPTIWSATLDALSFGRAVDDSQGTLIYLNRDEPKHSRLFVVSVGNIDPYSANPRENHLDRSDVSPIEDPSQAWNAISVGAYAETDFIDPSEKAFQGYSPVAIKDDLSPVSRTGVTWGNGAPIKPDVVESGGNWAVDPGYCIMDTPKSFQQLTTKYPQYSSDKFTTTSDTSAATAKVAAIAADIIATYPDYSLETVRGLVIYSARWTIPMLRVLDNAKTLSERLALVRRYGMGVPSLERALYCSPNSVNLISEASIKPFGPEGNLNEINWHRLPWPRDVLRRLGGETVSMRVTLSYFVEPNPSERGWKGQYAYPSFGLRFDTKRPHETRSKFRARVNVADRGEDYSKADTRENNWYLGKSQRHKGSVHSDIWNGTGAELAEMDEIAVYPVSGWWKGSRYDQSELGVNYSLIISLETDSSVDLWTPIQIQIESAIELET